jgi:hypothetical protein
MNTPPTYTLAEIIACSMFVVFAVTVIVVFVVAFAGMIIEILKDLPNNKENQ